VTQPGARRLGTDRWRVISPYLDEAMDLTMEQQVPWLAGLRGQDAALAADVEALLEEHRVLEREGFLAGTSPAPPGPPSLAGQTIGSYTLRSLIGQGGMGSVWLAERSDGRFEGTAAVKLLNPSLIGRDGEARFSREGSLLARLRHPHIAHLIDAGVAPSGQPYLVLERVDGEHIDRYCDARSLAVEARIRLFLDVLAAVAHAHTNLVVHRDIKPSNVLVDTDGKVKLLDFGVAKLLESEAGGVMSSLTRDGGSALTPEYAAPEQLTAGDITTATDVYALGVLLYVLLTGRHPAGKDTGSPAELIRAIVDTEPERASDSVAPRKLRAALRGDLDNILAKALRKRASERYATAEAMADDLRRYLGHRPVRARADSVAYRTRKFVARNRTAMGAGAIVLVALLASASVAVREARTAARQRDRALVQLQRAEATNDLANFLLQQATPSGGRPITNAEMLARGEALVERRFADDPVLRVHMLLTLSDRYYENQQLDRWQAVLDRAFLLSRGIADVGLRSRAACAKAFAAADQGKERQADALLAGALKDLAALPDAAWDEAYCRMSEANTANARGDDARALAAAQRAVALEEGRSGPTGRGFDALAILATAYLVAERPVSADLAFRRLMARLESLGLERSRTAATILHNWSVMLQRAGQYTQALPLSERAVLIGREQDSENGPGLTALTNYGSELCAVGRCVEAVAILEEAIAKARVTGSPRRLAGALKETGAAYTELRDFDRAARAFEEAAAIMKADPNTRADRYALLDRDLARLALARGDTGLALKHVQRGFAREKDADRGSAGTLDLLLVQGEVQNQAGDFDAARATAERAVKLASEGEMKRSSNAGQAHLELGIALAGQGDLKAGRNELAQALDHLRPCVGPQAPATRRAEAELQRLGS
jgi:serine/threonine-protein kinase